MTPLLTVNSLADYLQLHPQTVYRFLKTGKVRGSKKVGRWRFRKEDIDRVFFGGGK